MSKKVLITGGAGFVGSHLTDRMLLDGHRVVALDNLQTGSLVNLASARTNERFSFVEGSVQQPISGDFDLIFNLACPASPPLYQLDPIDTMKTNVLGALNVVELAQRCGAVLFQASTSEVYGDPDVSPQSESYRGNVNPIGPRACYDEGKRAAESILFDLHRTSGHPIKVARIFNTYGPRMDAQDGRVVSNFIVQALLGEPITIYGDGLQTRSFGYVDDLVEGFVRFVATERDTIGPINLGNPNEFTMVQLAELVIELTGSRSELVYCDLPEDDPLQRRPDISRARAALGWEPKVQLREGLERTIEYFSARVGLAAA